MTTMNEAPERVGMDSRRLERIHPVMQSYVDRRGYAGISVVIARRGQMVFEAQYGLRDKEAALPMTDDTIFRIYSMTKPIVCVAVMTLVEQGRLRLTDPVSAYLPAFAAVKVLAEDGTLADMTRPITVRDLLTHTSGLTNELNPTPVAARYREAGIHLDPSRSLEELIDVVAAMPIASQPGTRWQYSVGIDVAARLVEVLTGKRLGRFLDEQLFRPLNMTDTAFRVPPSKVGRLAALYGLPDIFAKGVTGATIGQAMAAGINERLDVSGTHPDDPGESFGRGGFGLFSTTGDYFRFAQMLANGGELDGVRLLGRKTIELMYDNHLPPALLPFGNPGLTRPGWGFGLGSQVMLDVAATGGPGSVGEHNWPGAANTYYWVDPKEQLVGVFMTQYMLGFAGPEQHLRALTYSAIAD